MNAQQPKKAFLYVELSPQMYWKDKKVYVLSQARVPFNNLSNRRQILIIPPWVLLVDLRVVVSLKSQDHGSSLWHRSLGRGDDTGVNALFSPQVPGRRKLRILVKMWAVLLHTHSLL